MITKTEATPDRQVTDDIAGPAQPGGASIAFALAPDDRTLFIANEENATTTVVDAQTRKVLAQIDVGIEPEGADVMRRSFEAGSPQRMQQLSTIADSLAPPMTTPIAWVASCVNEPE